MDRQAANADPGGVVDRVGDGGGGANDADDVLHHIVNGVPFNDVRGRTNSGNASVYLRLQAS